ncbi:hypothetical protein L873DRAFT_1718708 [Choiromyces venosus 120613-1]|uniref:BTB domain-containing protein n=1 Tax=Choiromyces venosus 120613-1 TaxID=1336337 RepID=A0A3N4IVJ3_9PEZI|nr:hypothetical protein L873DRAFT_1718708 [Choiromyces venosus 120613-1]
MSKPTPLPSPPTSPPRHSSSSGNTTTLLPVRETIISPVGDILLRLVTPTHTLHYKTSASVLITTSKVFSAMLSPTSPFSEARRFNSPSTEPFVLKLHDDDPVALCILLKSLHNHASVPRSLSFKQLVKMAVVVDKYDCSHATRMYGDRWMKDWTSTAERPGYEEWLFVAWVWGVEKIFGKLFGRVVKEVCVQRVEGGMEKVPVFQERKGGGGGGFGEYVPESVLKAILNHRANILSQLKPAFTSFFQRYQPALSSSAQLPLQCTATPPDPRCDALMFFSIYRKLTDLKLLPWNTLEDLDEFTVNELVDWVLTPTSSSSASGTTGGGSSSSSGGGMKLLSLEKHSKTCNPLEQLAAQVKLVMKITGANGEREVWDFRAREEECSWEEVGKEVGIK